MFFRPEALSHKRGIAYGSSTDNEVADRMAWSEVTPKTKLTRHQSGNRLFHSTETLSLHVTDYLFKAVDEKMITAMILIDLTKAFDSLSHNLLLCKLQDLAMGTSESSTKWFESYLAKDITQLE